MIRSVLVASALVLALPACGRVVFDERSSVESSSATSATGAGGSPASSSGADGGAAPGGPVGSGPAVGGAGPGGVGGAADGGGGSPAACDALVWSDDHLDYVLHDDEAGALLVHTWEVGPDDVEPDVTMHVIAAYHDAPSGPESRSMLELKVASPWTSPSWTGEMETWDGRDEPWLPAIGHGPAGLVARVQERLDLGKALFKITGRSGSGSYRALTDGIAAVRDFAFVDDDHYAVGWGDPAAPGVEVCVEPVDSPACVAVDLAPCADRPVPIAVEALAGGYVVAHAGARCAEGSVAPTLVEIAVVDDEGAVIGRFPWDPAGTVGSIAAARDGDAAWIAISVEESGRLQLLRVEGGGIAVHVGDVPLGLGRWVALASHPRGLAIVDGGPAAGDQPALRARIVDADANLLAETAASPPGLSEAEGTPAFAVSDDGTQMFVAARGRDADGGRVIVGVRAECGATP